MKFLVIFLLKLFALLSECNSSPVPIDESPSAAELSKDDNVAVLNDFLRILLGEGSDENAEIARMFQLSQQIRLIKNFSSDPTVDYDEIVIIKKIPSGHEIFSGNA